MKTKAIKNYIKRHKVMLSILAVVLIYLFWPIGTIINPVKHNGPNYDMHSFGQPWGDHLHGGIDIFADMDTPIRSASKGLVISVRENYGFGGNTVSILGMGGRVYYYAHMNKILTKKWSFVDEGEVIGLVGKTGNANRPGCPPHCHFSIYSPIPHFSNGHSSLWFKIDPAKVIDNNK